MQVHLLLEGQLEEPVADKLLMHCGHDKGDVYGKKGCNYIHNKAKGFRYLAQDNCGVLVLTDFRDTGMPCPSDALQNKLFLGISHPHFLCRLAVNELESWLLADRSSMARFLGISVSTITKNPDYEPFPKKTLVNLARRTHKSSIRKDIVPEDEHGGIVAPAYLASMTKFIREYWNIADACKNPPSLNRCVLRLQSLGNSTFL